MQKLLLSFLILAFSTLSLWAQDGPAVSEEQRSMSKGSHNALVVTVPEADPKDTNKAWQNFMRDYKGKTKYERRDDEVFSDDAEIEGINDGNTVDVYATIKPITDGAELSVWFNLGGAYVSKAEHPSYYAIAEQMLKDFTLSVSRDLIQEELEAAQKKLEDLNDDLEDLKKDKSKLQDDIQGYEKDIKKAEQNIKDAEQEISTNEESQSTKQTEIDEQRKAVEAIQKQLEKLK